MGNNCDLPTQPAPRPGPPPRNPVTPPTPPRPPTPTTTAPPTTTTPAPQNVPKVPGDPQYIIEKLKSPPPVTPGDTIGPDFFLPKGAAGGGAGVQPPPTDPGEEAPYVAYGCTTEFHYESGLLQCPVAAKPTDDNLKPPCVVLRTCAAYGQKIVRYSATRAGVQPLLPRPEPDDSTQLLLRADVVPEQPYLEPGASTLIYRVSALYVYALLEPRTFDEGFPVGAPAWSTLDHYETDLPPENFVTGIVGD